MIKEMRNPNQLYVIASLGNDFPYKIVELGGGSINNIKDSGIKI